MARLGLVQESFDFSRGTNADASSYQQSQSGQSPESFSEARVSELLAAGYKREGNKLYAPEEEYVTSWDRKRGSVKASYSPVVVTLDDSGRILSEERYAPVLAEASSSGAWVDYEPRPSEVKRYDYAAGVVETEQLDSRNRESFLATSQQVESEVKQGLRTSEPMVVQQRREAELVARRERLDSSRFRRVPTSGGRLAAYSGDVQVFSGSRVERAKYLKDPRSYSVRKSVESAQLRSDALQLTGYQTAEDLYYNKVKQNGNLRTSNLDGSAERGIIRDSVSGDSLRLSRTQGLLESQASFITGQQQRLQTKRAKILEQVGYREDASYWSKFKATAKASPFLALTLPEEIGIDIHKGLFFAEARLQRENPEIRKAALEEEQRVQSNWQGTFIEGFNPKTPEGALNLGATLLAPALPFASSKYRAGIKSNAFLKTLPKESLRGESFFGVDEQVFVRKGALVKQSEQVSIEQPGVIPVEERVIRTPVERVTLASGERTFLAQTPGQPQVTTVMGRGRFKDFTLRTVTDESGVSRADVFQLKEVRPTALDKLQGFARGKNLNNYDINLELVKSYKFKAPQGLAFTESLPQLADFRELKLEGYTQRLRSGLETSKGIPLSRKGVVPTGRSVLSYEESVQVGQKVPKTEILLKQDRGGEIQFGKTEFEVVDYPVATEKTIMRRTGDEFYSEKPVEFRTQADYLLKRKFSVDFEKIGRAPRPDVKGALVKQRAPVVNREFLSKDLKYRPYQQEALGESFKGQPARTFNAQPSRTRSYLSEQLGKNDPFGLSGDRLRPKLVDELVVKKVELPRAQLRDSLPSTKIYTETIPGVRGGLRAFPLMLNEAPVADIIPLSEPSIAPLTESIPQTNLSNIPINLSESQARSLSQSKNRLRNETRNRSIAEVITQLQTKQQTKIDIGREWMNVGGRSLPVKRGSRPKTVMDFETGPREQAVYNVIVRESRPKGKGKTPNEVRVNDEPLPRNAALNIGNEFTDNTSARSFKLVPAGQGEVADEPLFFDDYKYRGVKGRSRINPRFFIEKEKYLIDTPGEYEQLTAKALKARRRQSGFGSLFGGF